MPIRPMLNTDLPVIAAIENAAHIDPWSLSILKDCMRVGYDCWVLTEEEIIKAFAIMSLNSEGAHVLNVAVYPQYQRKGFGKRLMCHLIDIAKRKKAATMYLEVRVSNNAAQHLYETLGFNQVDTLKDYYVKNGAHEDAIVYAMELST